MRLGPSAKRVQTGTHFGLASIWSEVAGIPHLSGYGVMKHHFFQAMKTVAASYVTCILTVITSAMALALLAAAILLFENTGAYIKSSSEDVAMSLFVRDGAGETEIKKLVSDIRSQRQVKEALFHSKMDALEQFRRDLGGQSSVVEGLDKENPLPASVEVHFRESSPTVFQSFAEKYGKNPIVEEVHYNQGVVGQLGELFASVRLLGIFAVLLIAGMTAFIIGSTIKLALFAHKDEIEIMQLVGATEAFVRSPYMIVGLLEGVIGSILGLIASYACYNAARNFIAGSSFLSLVVVEPTYLSFGSLVLVMSLGVLIGLAGSYLTLRKFRLD